MSNTNIHQLSRFGVAANITVVAAFSLLTVVLISNRQDTGSNHEAARSPSIVQAVSLEQAFSGAENVQAASLEQALSSVEIEQTVSLEQAFASVKDAGG